MIPSSRTPEGTPNRCPICGKSVCIEPSSFPTYDAPCHYCGHLLWFADQSANLVDPFLDYDFTPLSPSPARSIGRKQIAEQEEKPFDISQRVVWAIIALFSAIIVWLNEESAVIAGVWLLGMIAFSQFTLPLAFRHAHNFLNSHENLYLGVILGWGLVPGPLVGVLFGVLLPAIYDCGLSSFAGGLAGIVIGPCFAVLQGLMIVSIVDVAMWIIVGTRLSRKVV